MGGYVDGKYYGPDSMGPGEMEWLPPATDEAMPVDVDEVPLPDDDSQPAYREERYGGSVHGTDYGSSKRPGSDPYEAGTGRLTPIQVSCEPRDKGGCGADVGAKCSFSFDKVQGQMGNRKRETISGERHVACLVRQQKADRT